MKKNWNKKHHWGIELRMPVYSTRRHLTTKDLGIFVDEFVELVEKHDWYTGGMGKIIDLNK